MPDDPFIGLFKHRLEIDLPGGALAENARMLAHQGLLHIQDCCYVRCIDPLDPDRPGTIDMSCGGRIYLSSDRDEENGDYQCPDCDREVVPSRKRQHRSIRLVPDENALRAFVRALIAAEHAEVEERPAGLYRIPTARRDVYVCLVDIGLEPALVMDSYPYRDTLVFVVGNDRDYLHRLPADIPTFRLAELALAHTTSSFHRTLRERMSRAVTEPVPWGPLIPAFASQHRARTPRPSRAPAPPDPVHLHAPPGTRWSEITLYLVDGETIAIRAPGQRLQRVHHRQLGLVNQRTGRPSKQWEILERLCEGYGHLHWSGTVREFNAFKAQVSRLRSVLQTCFGIHTDPFRTCSRRDGLQAAFQALPDLPSASSRLPSSWVEPVTYNR
jgi:hypothetical protein